MDLKPINKPAVAPGKPSIKPFKKEKTVLTAPSVKTATQTAMITSILLTIGIISLSVAVGIYSVFLASVVGGSFKMAGLAETVNSGLNYNANGNGNTNTNTSVIPTVNFVRGDANQDTRVDIGDVSTILSKVNNQPTAVSLKCLKAMDVDDDGAITQADADYLLANLFSNGPAPKSPYPSAGADPTADSLTCAEYRAVVVQPITTNYAGASFIRGDVNNDKIVNFDDIIYIIGKLPTTGDAPVGTFDCDKAADINNDGKLNVDDAILLMNSLYDPTHPAIPAPTGGCGIDPTADSLTCKVPVCGVVATVNPSQDTYIVSTYPTTAYGSSASLKVDNEPISYSYLKFNLSGLKGQVIDAKLKLYYTDTSVNGGDVYSATGSWTDSTLKYMTASSVTIGAKIGSLGAVTSGKFKEIPLTASAIKFIDGFTIVIKTPSTDGSIFNSVNNSSNKPALIIQYK